MANQLPTKKKRRPLRLLIPLAIAALLFYWFWRPIPPTVYNSLATYSGNFTVTYGEGVQNAQLGEHASGSVRNLLQDCRFASYKAPFPEGEEEILLGFADGVQMRFAMADTRTIAQVKTPAATACYRLPKEVYAKLSEHILTAFPGGVQMLEPKSWWEQYLCFAAQTLLGTDFNSPKEIAPEQVVAYTYLQMVADGTAKQYQTTINGKTMDVIPYDLFLGRSRRYFADGATVAMKQTTPYNAADNAFHFSAHSVSEYGAYPYPAWDAASANGYRLHSLTRERDGSINAVFEDYHPSGFKPEGTLTKIHFLTLLPAAPGEYRFLSKRSELQNPESVSAEGYFLSLGSIDGMTPEQAYVSSYGVGQPFGENLLLQATSYTKDNARLSLLLLDPRTGNTLTTRVLDAPADTLFWDVEIVSEKELFIKTNQQVLRLDAALQDLGTIDLPLRKLPGFDATGYDMSADHQRLAYADREGIKLYDFKSGISSLVAEHPYELVTPSSSSLPPPYISHYTRPADFVFPPISSEAAPPPPEKVPTESYRRPVFVQEEGALLVTSTGEETVLGYSLLSLKERTKPPRRLPILPVVGGVERIDDDKILITHYPETTGDLATQNHITEYSLLYFNEEWVRRFSLDFDPNAPTQYVQGDFLYYFLHREPTGGQTATDRFYQLAQVDLKAQTQQELSVLVQNALPEILGVSGDGRVLFSYRSPAGSGFGLTRDHLIEPAKS